jgi:hypothetical protein
MFCMNKVGGDVHFPNEDLLITKSKKIRVIMKIVESTIIPVHILGKFLGNALCPNHIYPARNIS